MITKFKSLALTVVAAFTLVFLLQKAGLWGNVSSATHSVVLSTGLMDARPGVEAGDEPSKLGKFDYNFTVKRIDGAKVPFDKFKGKVIFLNLWATWCGPCKAEMPGIQKLYASMDTSKVEFVMLSLDKEGSQGKIENYIRKNGYTMPVYLPSGYLAEQLRVPSIPTTFVISKEGEIVKKEVGTANYNTKRFKGYLENLAKE